MTHKNVIQRVVTTVGNITIRTHAKTTEIELSTEMGESSESIYLSKNNFKSLAAAIEEFIKETKEND